MYKPKLTHERREPLHHTLLELLGSMTAQYKTPISNEKVHRANILELVKQVTAKHKTVLSDDKFRIGSAQKALNLHLKYRWCLEKIAEPPHCPFDFYVLRKIPGWEGCRWTAINSIDDYDSLVEAARKVAGTQSLAVWVLELYNRLANKRMDAHPHR